MPFTDGNQRFSAGVINTEKLIALPGFDLTGIGEVNASHNNRPAAPYFNPDQDLTIDGGLIAANTIWRRYDDSWVQTLSVNAGLYDQAHYPGNVIATVRYEHRWRFDPQMEFRYGLELSRRVYDGLVENTEALTFGLRRSF